VAKYPLVLALLLLIPAAAAIGISPAILELEYAPGKTYVIPYTTYDAAHIDVYFRGDLAPYATVDDPKGNGTGPRQFTVSLTLPANLTPPGPRQLLVGVIEAPPPGAMIGGRAAYQSPVNVFVPYPGTYLDAQLTAPNVNVNETAPIALAVINRGTLPVGITPVIEVFNEKNVSVGRFTSDEMLLNSTDGYTFIYPWSSVGNLAGPYHAVGWVLYDMGTLERDAGFSVGEQLISVTDFTKKAVRGSIVPFVINVSSVWNSQFNEVYADVNINGTTFRTPSIDIGPAASGTLTGYWDLTNAPLGVYRANIILSYSGRTAFASGDVLVVDKELPSAGINSVQMTIIGGLFIIMVLLILLLMKRRRK